MFDVLRVIRREPALFFATCVAVLNIALDAKAGNISWGTAIDTAVLELSGWFVRARVTPV